MGQWTMADVRAVQARHAASAPAPPRQKFGNKKVTVDNILFDSKKESDRYLFLRMRERLGEIQSLDLQPVFPIVVIDPDGVKHHCGDYTADFRYWEGLHLHIEDTKSKATKTEAYQLRKTIIEALYKITIEEV
jgi:hypothetical protein